MQELCTCVELLAWRSRYKEFKHLLGEGSTAAFLPVGCLIYSKWRNIIFLKFKIEVKLQQEISKVATNITKKKAESTLATDGRLWCAVMRYKAAGIVCSRNGWLLGVLGI